ncbi:T9SS type A sorting domain-containing protein [candidate division KSB1 bacterium]|nr:T9SS type A sorting domain-containing protein [candidate division KSB1 bacterium]
MTATPKRWMLLLVTFVLFVQTPADCQSRKTALPQTTGPISLDIPARSDSACGGAEFADRIAGLNLKEREIKIINEILSGNVPSFCRNLQPVTVRQSIDSRLYEFTYYTVCDYMAVGSDQDYLYVPVTPSTAQYVADQLNCSLPTAKMVDQIYVAAVLKLRPQPIAPSDQMTTVPVFKHHTDSIRQQIRKSGYERLPDAILAGHKKDIILSNKIYSGDRSYDRVVIYGWHKSENRPIQPVYNGHNARYADYSHGVRLVFKQADLSGDACKIADILKDARLSALISGEGDIQKSRYPALAISSVKKQIDPRRLHFKLYQNFPNPFNPRTTITYFLLKPAFVELSVHNLLGRKVSKLIDKCQDAGEHCVHFNGMHLASGAYYYKLSTGDTEQTKKMLFIR